MKTTIKIIILIIVCLSQNKSFSQDTEKKYLLTVLDGDTYKQLFDFLVSKNAIESNQDSSTVVFTRKLVDDSLKIGIYKFGIVGSHQIPFLYIQSEDGIRFVNKYDIDCVLKTTRVFLKSGQKDGLDELKQIAYIKAIGDFLDFRAQAIKNQNAVIYKSSNK